MPVHGHNWLTLCTALHTEEWKKEESPQLRIGLKKCKVLSLTPKGSRYFIRAQKPTEHQLLLGMTQLLNGNL